MVERARWHQVGYRLIDVIDPSSPWICAAIHVEEALENRLDDAIVFCAEKRGFHRQRLQRFYMGPSAA